MPTSRLELAKLIVEASTPVLVSVIGFWLARIIKRVELAQWRNQKVIEKRMAVYDQIAPDLNALLCFFTYVGRWKELKPPDVIALKRKLDASVYVYQWLFSSRFVPAYHRFIHCCFAPFQGMGLDARLRTRMESRRSATQQWDPNWDKLFKEADTLPEEKVKAAYFSMMTLFAAELGAPRRDGAAESETQERPWRRERSLSASNVNVRTSSS